MLKVNKRLDEWVTADRLDMKKLQFPKKEAKTPTKNGLSSSRPSSPEREVVSRYYTAECLFHALRPCYNTVRFCTVIVQLWNDMFIQYWPTYCTYSYKSIKRNNTDTIKRGLFQMMYSFVCSVSVSVDTNVNN